MAWTSIGLGLFGTGIGTLALASGVALGDPPPESEAAAPPPAGLRPHVAFIAADDEYRSEITMPLLARMVERTGVARISVHLAADPRTGKPNEYSKTGLEDFEALRYASALVVYMRFAQLEPEVLEAMLAPCEAGRPIVGFRTSTHSFLYPADHPARGWNDGWGRRFLGTPWQFHHGHLSRTRVLPPTPEAAGHPLLRGVEIPAEGLVVRGWLYHVEPLPPDCTVLLWGESVNSANPSAPQRQPLLWTRELPVPEASTPDDTAAPSQSEPAGERRRQRVAVTTLGHPSDFEEPVLWKIGAAMVLWSIDREDAIPEDGVEVFLPEGYNPPLTR